MSVSLDQALTAQDEFTEEAKKLKLDAIDIRYVGREMILIGMGVERIGYMFELYQDERLRALKGKASKTDLQILARFTEYVDSMWGGGNVLDEGSLPTNEQTFDLPFNTYEARESIERNWRERLPKVLEKLQSNLIAYSVPHLD